MNHRAIRTGASGCALVLLALGCGVGTQEITYIDEAKGVAWLSPGESALLDGEPVELAVLTDEAAASRVRFEVDGVEVAVCDPAQPDEDCRQGNRWRWTVSLPQGTHRLTASVLTDDDRVVTAEKTVEVGAGAGSNEEGLVAEDQLADELLDTQPEPQPEETQLEPQGAVAEVAPAALTRDPDRAFHNVFGGIAWAVKAQRVELRSGRPMGSVSAVSTCMRRFGTSIRKWADKYGISRSSVVATALTESNCTNPRGSSDGLSSGPMQVTASTCSSVTGLSRSTCRTRMYTNPDFSFEVGVRYMASSYQRRQHKQDPPKIAAAYNAGSIRSSRANRWHMVSTGNHIDRFSQAYNAYRSWELNASAGLTSADALPLEELQFNGEHVSNVGALPADAAEGQVYFVGDFARRDGQFYVRRAGQWELP